LFRIRKPLFHQMIVVSGLGCNGGCSFCATSHHFKKRHISLFSGEALFDSIEEQAEKHPEIQSAVIYDEDFLARRENVEALRAGMARNPAFRTRPLLFTVFSSVRSVRKYSIEELVECGIGTIFMGVESFQDQVLEDEGLGKREGGVEDLFQELHEHGINTMGSLIIGWDGQTRESAATDAREFIALNPTFYQVVPLHPAPGTPLWDRLKNEERLLDMDFLKSESVGDFTFSLKNFSIGQAKAMVSDTYSGLVKEGGPWPFRLAENLLRGHLNLISAGSLIYRQRAAAYWKMLLPILPLVLLSGFMFRGQPFQERHREFRRSLRRYSPFRYHLAMATGLAFWPVLMLISWWGRLMYRLNPHGDQPNKIRRVYPASARFLSRDQGGIEIQSVV